MSIYLYVLDKNSFRTAILNIAYNETICGIQIVDSREIEILQLNDLLIGAIGYTYKGLKTSIPKLSTIEKIKELSNIDLVHTTSLCEHKFNIFRWAPRRM